MLIKYKKASDVLGSEITPKSVFERRRDFLKTAAVAGAGLALGSLPSLPAFAARDKIPNTVKTKWTAESLGPDDQPTKYDSVTNYNNFYEFGTDKKDPSNNAKNFQPLPWTVEVGGICGKPGKIGFEDLIKAHALEDRVYRFRCVEAWSMVVPWVGIPLGDVLKRFEPGADAKYVAFETLFDPKRMPGQHSPILEWPYKEGLRMDEAMNPLAILAVGLYGEMLPNQNGAPLRLVVPWKYGFKSIKSIVSIKFESRLPKTSWSGYAPNEYGFYSNVNPKVSHPRWSQASERRIGEIFRRDTKMFNGYEEEVASLYKEMDLRKWF